MPFQRHHYQVLFCYSVGWGSVSLGAVPERGWLDLGAKGGTCEPELPSPQSKGPWALADPGGVLTSFPVAALSALLEELSALYS